MEAFVAVCSRSKAVTITDSNERGLMKEKAAQQVLWFSAALNSTNTHAHHTHQKQTNKGDTHPVSIGHNTNLQDGVYVGSLNPASKPTHIGSFVSVGHGAVLQGCTVKDKTLIGMNAVVQEGAMVRV